jgi:hypothetical protein
MNGLKDPAEVANLAWVGAFYRGSWDVRLEREVHCPVS